MEENSIFIYALKDIVSRDRRTVVQRCTPRDNKSLRCTILFVLHEDRVKNKSLRRRKVVASSYTLNCANQRLFVTLCAGRISLFLVRTCVKKSNKRKTKSVAICCLF